MSVAKPWLFAGIALLVAVPSLRADKLSKEEKKWLDDVKPLMLADEEKTFKDLKDKSFFFVLVVPGVLAVLSGGPPVVPYPPQPAESALP